MSNQGLNTGYAHARDDDTWSPSEPPYCPPHIRQQIDEALEAGRRRRAERDALNEATAERRSRKERAK